MTVTNPSSRTIALGDGVTQTFSGQFELPAAADLEVWREETTNSTTTAISSGLYALAGVGGQTGFTITYPLTGPLLQTGESLILIRDVPLTQPTVLSNQGPYDA